MLTRQRSHLKCELGINKLILSLLSDILHISTLTSTSCTASFFLQVDTKVPKCDLQLVGVTAMLLASKIEEIYTPEIRDFVYITDNAYTPSQIKSCESRMAATLEFNFGDPLCIHFLRRNSKAAEVSNLYCNVLFVKDTVAPLNHSP